VPETFGCCSSYQECSDAGKCIHNDDEYAGCQYRKNLEKGHNFYRTGLGEIAPELFVAVKGSGWWSYSMKPGQEKHVFGILRGAGIVRIPQHEGACTSRVVMGLDDKKYIVYAPGPRLIPEAAAREIAGKLGGMAKVEVMAGGKERTITSPSPVRQERMLELKPVKQVKYEQVSIFDLMGG